jgi:hypothetical protein
MTSEVHKTTKGWNSGENQSHVKERGANTTHVFSHSGTNCNSQSPLVIDDTSTCIIDDYGGPRGCGAPPTRERANTVSQEGGVARTSAYG